MVIRYYIDETWLQCFLHYTCRENWFDKVYWGSLNLELYVKTILYGIFPNRKDIWYILRNLLRRKYKIWYFVAQKCWNLCLTCGYCLCNDKIAWHIILNPYISIFQSSCNQIGYILDFYSKNWQYNVTEDAKVLVHGWT